MRLLRPSTDILLGLATAAAWFALAVAIAFLALS